MSPLQSLRLTALLLLLGLGACGSVPPAPVDRYYRLQRVAIASATTLPGSLSLQPLRADSLYAERPLIYSDAADPRQLRQYHYHLWLYAPTQMIHDHLRASLAGILDLSGDARSATLLDGRIVRFERIVEGGRSGRAVVELEMRLTTGGKAVWVKTYQAEHRADDETVGAFVAAMEQALAQIYRRLLADLPVAMPR